MQASPSPDRADYRPDIDGLRAVAVIGVVAFHAFPTLLPGGFVGVDLFFVISGYLISRIVLQGLGEDRTGAQCSLGSFLAHFYARRIRRIFPALLLMLGAVLVAGWFMLMADDYARLGKHTLGGVLFISNLVLRNEAGYFDAASEDKPLLHLWSLGVEEQFYIFFPLVVAALYRRRQRGATLAVLVALFAASFALNLATTRTAPVSAFYFPQTRVWELLAGSLLAYVSLNRPAWLESSARAMEARAIGGAALIAAAFAFIGPADAFPGWWAVLPSAGAALLIAAGPSASINRLLSAEPLRWIGWISYPLYLWHWVALSLLAMNLAAPPSPPQRLAAVAGSVLAAWLTWRLLERKVQARKGRVVVGSLVAGAFGIGMVGAAVVHLKGVPSRFPDVLAGLVGADYPYRSAYREGRCLLGFGQAGDQFAPECAAPSGSQPQVLLWGDSHAAHWYPGLSGLTVADGVPLFRVAQYTASACPPLVGKAMPQRTACASVNDAAIAKIREARPDILVLSASWTLYDGRPGWEQIDPARLKLSVDAARAAGVERIVLIGPVPNWPGGLPKTLMLDSKRNDWSPPATRLANVSDVADRSAAPGEPGVTSTPGHLPAPLEPVAAKVDAQLRNLAAQWGVAYISPLSSLCDPAGCLTLIGNSLTAWDYGHLTTAASAFVMRDQLTTLLGSPIRPPL